MADMQAREALIAILSTAAAMGVDIDLLCHLSVAKLDTNHLTSSHRPYVAGAIYQIGVCMNYVVDVPR
ncbi:hypothetical protein [Pseudomonas sp. MH10]|uniref:hypothetical protein n=1 Tax=Pseudomonas sp. MH10 TaxID=3048627 RepID=UPI002AC8D1FC|nr:hypothetical protein [Pseudomonas sp. MH10]MEB0042985.1 hypothetical protein [Pseudomonas sp. MH10]WPX63566.1 hypothetical protein RHM59_22260 [Pseudomonas sp. MH10]